MGDGNETNPFYPGIPSPWQGLGWLLAWLRRRGSSAPGSSAAAQLLLGVAEPVNIMGNVSVENHFVGQQGRHAGELAGIPAALVLPLAARASFPLSALEQMNHCQKPD